MSSRTRASSRRLATARWQQLDWILLAAVAALVVLGCLLVYSATLHRTGLTGGNPRAFLERQVISVVLGLLVGAVVAAMDHRWLRTLAPLGYLAAVIGLVLVLVIGTEINGSQSWLVIGGMTWQPAELAKLAVVVGMALVLAERAGGGWRGAGSPGVVLTMLVVIAVPAGLILAQPDMGTLLVLGGAAFGALAVAGVARWWLVGVVAGGALALAAAVTGGLLKQYQINRFLAFTDPSLDPRGAGYNVDQARIAIGNGGLFGQGLFNGSQTRAGFVPEQQTDFIFTVAGEELGLVGALLIVGLFGVLLWRALAIAARAEDAFGRVAAAGIACWFGLQAFWNIGMCLGIMPVTGIPLPFVSYGGSSMLACLAAVGILQSIHLRTLGSPGARSPHAALVLRSS